MENVNLDILCGVESCKHNHNGCNCTLDKIRVGCSCDGETCTCCESYSKKCNMC